MKARYFARSASDKTDDWRFWFVAKSNDSRRNVTHNACAEINIFTHCGAVFTTKENACWIAEKANEATYGKGHNNDHRL